MFYKYRIYGLILWGHGHSSDKLLFSTELIFYFYFCSWLRLLFLFIFSRNFSGADIHFIKETKCPPGPHHLNGTARMPTLPFSFQFFIIFFFFLIHAFTLTDHTRDLGYLLHILSWIMFSAGKRQHPRLRNLRRILKRDNLQSTALGLTAAQTCYLF